MKYRNEITRKLLKQFRMFIKYAPKKMYAMSGDQEEEFNKDIEQIINKQIIKR